MASVVFKQCIFFLIEFGKFWPSHDRTGHTASDGLVTNGTSTKPLRNVCFSLSKHSYDTIQAADNLFPSHRKAQHGLTSLSNIGCQTWNSVPREIQSAPVLRKVQNKFRPFC